MLQQCWLHWTNTGTLYLSSWTSRTTRNSSQFFSFFFFPRPFYLVLWGCLIVWYLNNATVNTKPWKQFWPFRATVVKVVLKSCTHKLKQKSFNCGRFLGMINIIWLIYVWYIGKPGINQVSNSFMLTRFEKIVLFPRSCLHAVSLDGSMTLHFANRSN